MYSLTCWWKSNICYLNIICGFLPPYFLYESMTLYQLGHSNKIIYRLDRKRPAFMSTVYHVGMDVSHLRGRKKR